MYRQLARRLLKMGLKMLMIMSIIASMLMFGTGHDQVQAVGGEPYVWTDEFQRADSDVLGNGWVPLRGTWVIGDHTLQSQTNETRELLVAQTDQELGRTFKLEAELRNTESRWNGVAFNITDNGDGTQSYYVLRFATYANQPGAWQLLQVSHSTVGSESLIARGTLAITTGSYFTVQVSSHATGVLNLQVSNGDSTWLDERRVVPLDRLQVGGYAGFYSESGKLQVQRATIETTSEPAVLPTWTDQFNRPDHDQVGDAWTELRGNWTIAGQTLRAATDDAVREKIVAQTAVELGRSFTMEATLRNTATSWNGMAFNIVDNSDGTQDYYAVRIVTYADGRAARWQLLQVKNSIIDSNSLVQQGTVSLRSGEYYTMRVTVPSYGVVRLEISDHDAQYVDRTDVLPPDRFLIGGYAGFYSESGNLQVRDVSLTNSSDPAIAQNADPLVWTPVAGTGDPYSFLASQERVVDKLVVDTTWAGHPVGQSLLTDGEDQYVAYYNADRQMVVAQRKLDSEIWVKQTLDNAVGWDSHNFVTMSLDSAGQLHVSGNMHNVPLIYYRTTTPGDVTTLTRISQMVHAATEQVVTYPTFMRTAGGELVFRYRDGYSGNGADFYNIYDATTQTWSRLLDQPLHDGQGLRNAYVDSPRLGPDGYYHIAWVWRDSGNAATNQHLSYARSADLIHWEKSDGTSLSLPITYASGEIVDPIPMNGGLINGNAKIGFDHLGRVVIGYHKYDALGNLQIYMARLEEDGWNIRQISQWSGKWAIWGHGSLSFEVGLGRVSALEDGNLRFDFTVTGRDRTWILRADSLVPIVEIDTPQLPAEIRDVRSSFPGIMTRISQDLGTSPDASERYVLRWESLPSNQDRPWDPPYPEAASLEVYKLSSEEVEEQPVQLAAPGKPILSDDNGHDHGLRDGAFTIRMDMWYGQNGDVYKLYEDGMLIDTQQLAAASPLAQSAVTAISGKGNGTYRYHAELIAGNQVTVSEELVVTVSDALPGMPVLSHNNWDMDGQFTVRADMWWGSNASRYAIYENGELLQEQDLAANTPNAQFVEVALEGRVPGTYLYQVALINDSGQTLSETLTVVVAH